ncbi:MAG: M23 family metallopeptidase [Candidatus Thorarchaeota archaeon]|nr:M23 family metallopeptidase [Candidatus Thorarchaeota archaeon]
MRRKIVVAIIAIIMIVAGGFMYYRNKNDIGFDPGTRYDSTRLDNMDVIYANRSDIIAFNEGYSESDNCPWGFPHNGIDFFFKNGSAVIAAAPGQVESIEVRDNGENVTNRFHVSIVIRFNTSLIALYNFEPWTQNSTEKDQQLALLNVQVGDWVGIGDRIATFLKAGSGAHIHFGVGNNGQWYCPRPFYSDEAYTEIMTMIHSFHADWDLCYP